jgi:asparagine synthase (glutamine-hydrolysing)
MCAITGIISSLPNYRHATILQPVLAAMAHRGPDGSHIVNLTQGCFGHNRLAIIDVNDRAAQPMWDSSRRYCLSFNGEIYNYRTLQQELSKAGHIFRTQSDSEVLIEAWAKWGSKCLQRLVGMFAFAIWDQQEQQLYLVRDRMGEKPLYYTAINNDWQQGLAFASELKGLVHYPFVNKTLSMSALSHYLSFNYTATNDAILTNIYKLPPASYLQYDFNTKTQKIIEYWSLAYHFQHKLELTFKEAEAQLNNLLINALKEQTIADVPLGAFLSGGLDSSTIVAHMRTLAPKQVNTYSIGFSEKTYSELNQSAKTAKYLDVQHQSKIISANIHELLPKLAYAFDEPFADSSLIPTYLLCAFAKEHVTVSLSGDGGDELFGGYVTYQADRYYQKMQYLPLAARKILARASQYLPTSFAKISWDYKLKQFLQGALLDAARAHLSWREIFNPIQKQALLQSEYQELSKKDVLSNDLAWFNDVASCHYLDQAMYVDIKTWLVDDILLKVDRAAMSNSLEVRAPFLDHRIVEFAAALPIEYKIKGHSGKYVLKKSQAPQLPPHVLQQPKRGFNSPISHWLAHDLFAYAYELTTSTLLSSWFNKETIMRMWQEHRQGRCDHGHRLFNLLSLALWYQGYLKVNH